jgi:hypothetical protein
MSARKLDGWTGEKPVRRLLRLQNSEQYFKDDGWTTNPDEARSFADALEAAETCARYHLSDVELTLRFDSRAGDVFKTKIR